MQYTYEPNVHSHVRIKREANPARVSVHNWWQVIAPNCDSFFELSAIYNLKAPRHEQAQILIDLENICSIVEFAPYPPQVTDARVQLLGAMSNVMVGFSAALRGDTAQAAQHTDKARRQLEKFSNLLDALGID